MTAEDINIRNKRKRLTRNAGEEKREEGEDMISHLPQDCITHIFTFLPDSRDRCSCAAVSKRWLNLQAKMRSSEFRSYAQPDQEISRCLDWENACDTRLAAVVVGVYPRGILTELIVRASSFPSSPAAYPPGISDTGLKIIAQACPNLKVLVLWNCVQVGDEGLTSIAKGCSALQKLDLSNNPSVSDHGLIAIAVHSKRLSTLSLESCPLIGSQSLMTFARPSSQLKSINLVRCPLVGDTGILWVICILPKLAGLKIAMMKLGDAVLKAIGERARQLRVLCLENVRGPSGMGYSWIGAAEEMECLSLKSCAGLTTRSFKRRANNSFAGLKKVSIINCASLTDEGLLELTKSTQSLESLTLECCGGLTYGGLMQAIANCSKKLKVLSVVKCDISGNQEGEPPLLLQDYSQLGTLKLTRCGGVGDYFLAWMGGACRRVKHVMLVGMGGAITDRGLFALLRPFEGSKELESLDLGGCAGISDRSVLAIMNACGGTLQSLRLEGCKGLTDQSLGMIGTLCPGLQELDLSECRISDAGVFSVAEAAPSGLQVLSLEGCAMITDRSLWILELMCSGLEMLNLKRCHGLTQQGIDSVRDTLFWCDLIA